LLNEKTAFTVILELLFRVNLLILSAKPMISEVKQIHTKETLAVPNT